MPRPLWIAAACFAALSLLSAVLSKGFIEADAATHYISAHFALQQPHRLVSVWDRPLFMLLYTLPAAWGGVMGVRAMSLLLALVVAWSAWRMAAKLGMRRPELAFIFVVAQPLLFLHSFAEMTELCFAAVIGLAFLAYLNRRWGWMALLVAISPLGRPEGFGFLLLAAIALLAHRQARWLLVLPLAVLSWCMIGWLMWGLPDYGRGPLNFLFWLRANWPYSGTSMYEPGPLLLWKKQATGEMAASFLLRLPVIVSPLLFPFTLVGTVAMLRNGWRNLVTHAGRCELFAVGLPWGILVGHSLLWWMGKMASSGELRYLLVVAPLWGVIGAIGFERSLQALSPWSGRLPRWAAARPVLLAGLLAVVPTLANARFQVVPFKQYADDLLGHDVAGWYQADADLQTRYPRVAASHPSVYLALDISPTDRDRSAVGGKELLVTCPAGVLYIWDPVFSTHNADAAMCVSEADLAHAGWQKARTFTRGERNWAIYLSPKAAGK